MCFDSHPLPWRKAMNIRFAHVLAALTLITPSMLCASLRDAEACLVGPEPLSMPRARDASNMLPSNFITYLDPSAATLWGCAVRFTSHAY